MLNEETGLLTVSVDEAAKMLSKSYINLLRRGIAFKKFPANNSLSGIPVLWLFTKETAVTPWGKYAYIK